MHKIDIQPNEAGTFDVLVNGDHHERCATHAEAIKSARAAAGDEPRYSVMIRDFTTMGEGRTAAGVPFAIVPRREPQA